MPQKAWSDKRERRYEHIAESEREQGRSPKRAKEIAARTVNKERARAGGDEGADQAVGIMATGTLGVVDPKTLDHVAFWVADRKPIVDFLTAHVGMHVIDEQDAFTLVGSNARRGKLTLFAADPPREQGAFKHVGLRVSDVERARAALPNGSGEDIELGEGVRVRLVEAPTDVDYDLDHVAVYSSEPEQTAGAYARLGFRAAEPSAEGNPRVEVGGAYVEFHPGEPGDPEKPLLNHLAVLVDSVEEHITEAEELGIVDNVVDAANTRAVFVWGPERVRIEYVEHKPGFALT